MRHPGASRKSRNDAPWKTLSQFLFTLTPVRIQKRKRKGLTGRSVFASEDSIVMFWYCFLFVLNNSAFKPFMKYPHLLSGAKICLVGVVFPTPYFDKE